MAGTSYEVQGSDGHVGRKSTSLAMQSNGILWCICSEGTPGSGYQAIKIYYSSDFGKTWTLSHAISGIAFHSNYHIAVDSSDHIHILYYSGGVKHKSYDGANWSAVHSVPGNITGTATSWTGSAGNDYDLTDCTKSWGGTNLWEGASLDVYCANNGTHYVVTVVANDSNTLEFTVYGSPPFAAGDIYSFGTGVASEDFGFVIDKDDYLYCFWTWGSGYSAALVYTRSVNAGAGWSNPDTADIAGEEVYAGGSGNTPQACVDDDGDVLVAWDAYLASQDGQVTNIRLATLAYGGAWSGEWATLNDDAGGNTYRSEPWDICCASGSNPAVYIVYSIRKSSSDYDSKVAIGSSGGSWTQEVFDTGRTYSANIMVDGGGVVRVICALWLNAAGSENDRFRYLYGYRVGTDSWDIETTEFDDDYNRYGGGVRVLWARHPQVAGIATNIPLTGFGALYHDMPKGGSGTVRFFDFAGYGIIVYPSDAQTRVASIIHRYNRGIYNMELCLGEVIADFGIPSVDTEAQKSYYGAGYVSQIPRGYGYVSQPPVCPPGTVPKWTWEEGWTCVASPFAGATGGAAAGTPQYGAGYVSQAPSCPAGTFPKWTANGWICAPSTPPASGWTTPPLSGIYPSTEKDITPGSLYIPPEVYSTTPAQEAAKEAFKGTTAEATVGTSSSPPSCPAGTIPRYIDGKWKCVPHDPGTTAGGGYAR